MPHFGIVDEMKQYMTKVPKRLMNIVTSAWMLNLLSFGWKNNNQMNIDAWTWINLHGKIDGAHLESHKLN
jgi:hypothetical protein